MTTVAEMPDPGSPPPTGRALRVVIWVAGLMVAVGAAVATAHGLYEVALAARVPAGIAWLYPLITDGLALVAYAASARLHGPPARYAWSVVVLAAGLSGLAQAALLASGSAVDARRCCGSGSGPGPRSPPRSSRICSTSLPPPTPRPLTRPHCAATPRSMLTPSVSVLPLLRIRLPLFIPRRSLPTPYSSSRLLFSRSPRNPSSPNLFRSTGARGPSGACSR